MDPQASNWKDVNGSSKFWRTFPPWEGKGYRYITDIAYIFISEIFIAIKNFIRVAPRKLTFRLWEMEGFLF